MSSFLRTIGQMLIAGLIGVIIVISVTWVIGRLTPIRIPALVMYVAFMLLANLIFRWFDDLERQSAPDAGGDTEVLQ